MKNFLAKLKNFWGPSFQARVVTCFITTLFYVTLRPRLHGIGSRWDRIHLDPIHFLRGVYTGSDPKLLAFTRDRIQLDFMNF